MSAVLSVSTWIGCRLGGIIIEAEWVKIDAFLCIGAKNSAVGEYVWSLSGHYSYGLIILS